jgi:hypothetical protein
MINQYGSVLVIGSNNASWSRIEALTFLVALEPPFMALVLQYYNISILGALHLHNFA